MTYEFVTEARHPARRPEVGQVRPDHEPARRRTSSRRRSPRPTQGQEHPVLILDADEGITADPNVRKALNLAVDKEAIAEQIYGGFAVIDEGQLLSPSILGYNDSTRAVCVRPRRGQASDRGGRRRRRDDHARRRVVGPLAERPRTARGGRRLLDARPGSRSTSRRPSSAPTSTSCSTATTAPTRSSCRARTTSSTPTASSPRTTRRAASARRTPTRSCRRSSTRAAPSSIRTPGRRSTRRPCKIAYDEAYFAWLVSNEDIYGLSERLQLDAAGRLQAARQGDDASTRLSRSDVRPGATARPWVATSHERLAAGAGGHLRGHRVRVRRHPHGRRSREVHAAALGHRGTARRHSATRSASTIRSRRSSSTSSATWSGSTSARAPTSAASRRSSVVFDYLPAHARNWSAFGMLLAVVLSVPLGVLASPQAGRAARPAAHHAQPVGLSMPQFFLGGVLLIAVHGQAALVPDRCRAVVHATWSCPRSASRCRRSAGWRWWSARR